MKSEKLPYRQLIFVCTNARKAGERISCAGEGRCGETVLKKLKAYVSDNKLDAVARVAKSGCQEKCELGPSVAVMPQNDFLTAVDVADADRIIETYLKPLLSSSI
jgi:(2Fe-2S) ferredoxin